ncbi:hypothetical protein [Burkholderia sp. BE17]|uniref:hypothetical protein n=1 Tax=Burkholderia sp. BE17 TaxID=2656644 RepID=UPI00128C131C|nr:hypothetical protein [Burkholderia sp. BE17]MPV65211.1 hypothetical protein [Burkholderia sp. BE17]
MSRARIALYKSKKIADRPCHCAFHRIGFDRIARGNQASRRQARLCGSECSLARSIGNGGNRRNQAVRLREYRRWFDDDKLKPRIPFPANRKKGYRMQCGIIATKQIAGLNPFRIQAGACHSQWNRQRAVAAALHRIMPMPTFPAPSPA